MQIGPYISGHMKETGHSGQDTVFDTVGDGITCQVEEEDAPRVVFDVKVH